MLAPAEGSTPTNGRDTCTATPASLSFRFASPDLYVTSTAQHWKQLFLQKLLLRESSLLHARFDIGVVFVLPDKLARLLGHVC